MRDQRRIDGDDVIRAGCCADDADDEARRGAVAALLSCCNMRLDEIPPDVAYTRDQASRNIPDGRRRTKLLAHSNNGWPPSNKESETNQFTSMVGVLGSEVDESLGMRMRSILGSCWMKKRLTHGEILWVEGLR